MKVKCPSCEGILNYNPRNHQRTRKVCTNCKFKFEVSSSTIIAGPPNINRDLVRNETEKGPLCNSNFNHDAENDHNVSEQSDGCASVPLPTEHITSQEAVVQNATEKGPSCSQTINQGLENDQDSATMQSARWDVLDPKSSDYQIIRYLTHPDHVNYQKQVASLLQLDKSTISRKTKIFLEKGYIFKINEGKEGKINIYRANPELFPEFAFPRTDRFQVQVHDVQARLDVLDSSLKEFERLRKTLPTTPGWKKKGMKWEQKEIRDDMIGDYGWWKFKHPKFRIFVTTKSFIFYPYGFGKTAEEAERDAKEHAFEIKTMLEQNYNLKLDISFGKETHGREHHFNVSKVFKDKSHPDSIEGVGEEGGEVITGIVDSTNKVPKLESDFQQFRSETNSITKQINDNLKVMIKNQANFSEIMVKMTENMGDLAKRVENLHKINNHENNETKHNDTIREIPQNIYL